MTHVTTPVPTTQPIDDGQEQEEPVRDLELRIRAAPVLGFAIYEGVELVAALTTRQEVADWITTRLSVLPGEPQETVGPTLATPFSGPRIVQQRDARPSRWGWRA